ncbi:MAG: sulfatase-like hydrolase/transferase [Magnetococcales bacterium]|nr:sulfatase-like hydrolase/transferase [Magnetococcales bacterium]
MPLTLLLSIIFNRYTFFLGIVLLYIDSAPIIELTKGVWRMEIPLLLYLYFCFNNLIKPSRWQAVVAALPLAMLYLGHDYYFMRFARIPKWIECTQIPELIGVLDMKLGPLLGASILIPLVIFISCLKISPKGVVLLLPALLVFVAPFQYPDGFLSVFRKLTIEIIYYSTSINVGYNGRIVTSLYHEAKRRETLKNLINFRDLEQLSLRVPPEMNQKTNGKNVHLIILESFIDPTLFDTLPKSIKPTHPDYLKLVQGQQGFSISPIFGGYTAQPEFEALCGVPAFQEFDQIEFNIFTGSKTYCLPAILKGFGYKSTASNAYKPEFFNTIPAYRGLDFDSMNFAKEYTPTMETYLSKGAEENNQFFFDEDLFAQNLAFVQKMLDAKKPFFNYLLTVYGHFPFDLGARAGPPLFTAPDMPSAVDKILNQYYYRTKALASYLNRLMEMDPTALIVLASDHLPPLPDGIGEYDTLGYFQKEPDRLLINRFLVFRAGKIEKYDRFAHFNIYRLILDFVTDHAYCQAMPCNFGYPADREAWRNDYRTIIGLASR